MEDHFLRETFHRASQHRGVLLSKKTSDTEFLSWKIGTSGFNMAARQAPDAGKQGRCSSRFTMNNPFNEDETLGQFGDIENPSAAGIAGEPPASQTPTTQAPRRTEEKNSVITARGTAEGLVLRIDGRVEAQDLVVSVREFLESRRSFLSGNDVAYEWIGRKPEETVVQTLTTMLGSEFSVSVRASKAKPTVAKQTIPSEPRHADEGTIKDMATFSVVGGGRPSTAKRATTPAEKAASLFDGIEAFDTRAGAQNPMSWDDPDARIMYGTLRSGQKVETEHSIIIFGDVNSGAEVIAGGDVVILGTLRGIAHAGAYDESGGGRVIFSLNLQPTQLRIGLVISRGSGNENAESTPRGGLPEVARVDGNMIVVEPYQSRTVWVRRRE